MRNALLSLQKKLSGELMLDSLHQIIYATDASVYRELPLAVCYPKNEQDLVELIHFANEHKVGLIPRTAGTSLAGQCVGNGIVVDVSKHLNQIIELNVDEGWVSVEPGVIRDELNRYLEPYDVFFAPNTSTSNRCMIGGMVGNNSCGTTSIKYGDTRAHVLEIEAILADGSKAKFSSLTDSDFELKKDEGNFEATLYQEHYELLRNEERRQEIINQFPKKEVVRRNTGYVLDELCESSVFGGKTPFDFCKLLAGSEGTLAFFTTIKLKLTPLPPKHKAVVCAHFSSIDEALKATVLAVGHVPDKVEMMDDTILDCTAGNLKYEPYRFFVEQRPKAIIIVEFARDSEDGLNKSVINLISEFKGGELGYAFPVVYAEDINKVWALRKAGLGLLANLKGDAKAVSVIEDTAVAVTDLPAYIADFKLLLERYKLTSVFHAHAGAGELHLRPILDLKLAEDRKLFRQIGEETALLVKKYRGSNSGEHGDGRVRGEFVKKMVGDEVYGYLEKVKAIWDPNNIFNPGKIVDAPPMDADFRYEENQKTRQFDTVFDFNETGGILRMAEKCNGSGDCRKSHTAGGTMCPSYMASKNEKDTTRARANVLREILTQEKKPFEQKDLMEVLDLCLSCKGCTSECPSNVNMTMLKAETTYQYYHKKGFPLRSKLFAHLSDLNKWFTPFTSVTNLLTNQAWVKKMMGVATERSLPKIQKKSLRKWITENQQYFNAGKDCKGKVNLFIDEFTNYLDVEVGIAAIKLLHGLGYSINVVEHEESGRAALSKGLLIKARSHADKNVAIFHGIVDENMPLVGIEPSAILGFVDEYPRLVSDELKVKAKALANHVFTIEGFLFKELEKGNLSANDFTKEERFIKLHGHCHQKALTDIEEVLELLSLPENFHVEYIPSGCCGMAGSFGYEKEHYEMSMQIGEMVLFPAVRGANEKEIIVASGTSCRHQIYDGTGKRAVHAVELLLQAII